MSRTAYAKRKGGLMSAGLVLAVLLLCSLFYFLPAKSSRGARLLEKTVAKMEQLKDYELTIIENAPKYELSFKGRVDESDELRGSLPAYDLEIMCEEEKLLLRQRDAPEWKEAEELGLHGLAGFLITPLQLLRDQKGCFGSAVLGETISMGEIACQTVYFSVAGPRNFAEQLFPQIDGAIIGKIIVAAAVAKKDGMLKQLRILVELGENSEEEIERCYSIEP